MTVRGDDDAEATPAPHLSLVVPAYNEERRIGESMRRIGLCLASLPYSTEVIGVDDGSADAGRQALQAAMMDLPVGIDRRIVRHDVNRGKGAAVRTGALAAKGEYIAFIDADLATSPEDLTKLVAALDAGAEVAIGVRNQADGSDMRDRRGLARRLAGRGYAWVMRRLLLPDISDSQCPLKAFHAGAARRIFPLQRIDTWAFDAELLYLARKLCLRIEQVPVTWHAVQGSTLRLDLRTASELLNLIRIRWWHRDVQGVQKGN